MFKYLNLSSQGWQENLKALVGLSTGRLLAAVKSLRELILVVEVENCRTGTGGGEVSGGEHGRKRSVVPWGSGEIGVVESDSSDSDGFMHANAITR